MHLTVAIVVVCALNAFVVTAGFPWRPGCNACRAPPRHALLHNFGAQILFAGKPNNTVCNCGSGHVAEVLAESGTEDISPIMDSVPTTEAFIRPPTACLNPSDLRVCRNETDCCRVRYDTDNSYKYNSYINLYVYCRTRFDCQAYALLAEADTRLECVDRTYSQIDELSTLTDDYMPIRAVHCNGGDVVPSFKCPSGLAQRETHCPPVSPHYLNLYVNGLTGVDYSVGQAPNRVCYCGQNIRYSYSGSLDLYFNDNCPTNANYWLCNSPTQRCCKILNGYFYLNNICTSTECQWQLMLYGGTLQCPDRTYRSFNGFVGERFDSVGCSEEQARNASKCNWSS